MQRSHRLPVVILLGRKLNLLDSVNARKIHCRPVPRIGGIAIFISATSLLIIVMLLDNYIGRAFRAAQTQVITLLAAGSFIFVIGLIDDIKGLRARHKLLAQIIAAVVICLSGAQIKTLNIANIFTLNLGWLAIPITVFWIISITNAVNLIDGLDGLAAGISAVTCGIIAILAFNYGQPLMVVFMLSLLGSLSGFLLFNFNPARIFLGDSGSMFLGFVLASTSVICAVKSGTIVALALPALALGLPIFDTIFSMLRRYLHRWGIMSPDRGHFHHRLLDMGLRHQQVVIVMYAMTVVAAGLGMFMTVTTGGQTIAVFFSVILLLILLFRVVGAIRFRETIAHFKYNRSITREIKKDLDIFEDAHLKFDQGHSFKHWWRAICDAAEKAGFMELCVMIKSKSGRYHSFIWQSQSNQTNPPEIITLNLQIDKRRFGLPMDIQAKIPVNGLLESAGRRMMLFGRLIDEYNIERTSGKYDEPAILEIVNTAKSDDTPLKV